MNIEEIKSCADAVYDEAVRLRRKLHSHPELSFQEQETAALVAETLEEIGLPFRTGVAKTGVVGELTGAKPGRTLLLRADMDALPVTEETGLPFASELAGQMHACGHDGHVAILLGTAMVLSMLKDQISGTVRFVFQPGEEDTGGAEPMIREGVLDGVSAAAGLHLMPDLPCGVVRAKEGPLMACPDEFDMVIHGRGGHGAYPEETVDPVVIAAHVITAVQTLAARYASPLEPKVISICAINGGSFYNVTPEEVTLKGTVRLFDSKLRERIPGLLRDVAGGIARSFGGDLRLDYRLMFPPLVNDGAITEAIAKTAEKLVGAEHVIRGGKPSMAGDDFAYFAQAVPSSYIHLGCGVGEALHSPRFFVDEECLRTGIAVMSGFALDYLK